MSAAAQAMSALLLAHRSIRRYEAREVDPALVERALVEALAGSSSSGNLNMVSVVRTRDPERRRRLYELHFEQPMVLEAPLVLTFCADTFRTREWLALRNARPGFAEFLSWHVAGYDAIVLAQSAALALESHGLGICYMGTTLYSMRAIADFLELPPNCLPVTSMVVGWPAESPSQRDRLPPAAWIHDERYRRPAAEDIERDFAARESRGRERYFAHSPEMRRLWEEHGITSLAQFYTSRIKYDPDVLARFAADLEALLRERGFLG
ncbi:MAG: nitroreductase family protein [Rubrivivax sp.]